MATLASLPVFASYERSQRDGSLFQWFLPNQAKLLGRERISCAVRLYLHSLCSFVPLRVDLAFRWAFFCQQSLSIGFLPPTLSDSRQKGLGELEEKMRFEIGLFFVQSPLEIVTGCFPSSLCRVLPKKGIHYMFVFFNELEIPFLDHFSLTLKRLLILQQNVLILEIALM